MTALPVAPVVSAGLLEADASELTRFIPALFRYAERGFVSWRAFGDGADKKPIFIQSSHVQDDGGISLIEPAMYWATQAANHPGPVVFCPPIAIFANAKRAREIDLANGLALSVECDAWPQRARSFLEQILGPATVVVASGGVWTDPADSLVHEKLHLHWRLSEPTSDAEEHARLKKARILATRLVGGDATNVPAVHPIRWPGSWHRKGHPKLARIIAIDEARELTLSDALEQLELAASTLPPEQRAALTLNTGSGADTSSLVAQLLSGDEIHAPLCALAFRYLAGGMNDGAAVMTLRGMMDAIPSSARGAAGRWEAHYGDVPRTVRTAREKIGTVEPTPTADISAFVSSVSAPAIVIARPADAPKDIPTALLAPPGILADVAQWGLATSVRPVPIFAVQAALALGSIICARRYVTSQRNYSSLYFLNVAKSGTGKEEAKTTIERILKAAGFRRLIGPPTYSSGNAVFSALLKKPAHLAIVDEFGKYMEAAAREYDNYRTDTIKQLMEAFGRVHGDMGTPQLSTLSLTAGQAGDVEPKIIQRPAITLLAMTTPSSFYDAMRSSRIQDGFLNRFLVAEHTAPREVAQEYTDLEVPPHIVSWVQALLAPHSNLDVGVQVDSLPDPAVVEFSPDALKRTRTFEREMLDLSASLDREGLGDMPIRSREIAMRLALVCTLADTPDTPVITTDIIDWCCEYVTFFLHQTLESLRTRVADSTTERIRNQVLSIIRAAGPRGVTRRDLNRDKAFFGMVSRDQMQAINSLVEAELIAYTTLDTRGQRGRPRVAWVALDDTDGAETGPALVSDDEDASSEASPS